MHLRYLVLSLVLLVAAAALSAKANVESSEGSCLHDKDCLDESLFCKYALGMCGSGAGVCSQKPFACHAIYSPVCGCDGQTYSNECSASAAGVSVVTASECASALTPEYVVVREERSACSTNSDCSSTAGTFCKRSTGSCSSATGACVAQPQMCPFYYSPVCGCNGQTYSNACHAARAGVSVSQTGEC